MQVNKKYKYSIVIHNSIYYIKYKNIKYLYSALAQKLLSTEHMSNGLNIWVMVCPFSWPTAHCLDRFPILGAG